jgi:hypothetical protein
MPFILEVDGDKGMQTSQQRPVYPKNLIKLAGRERSQGSSRLGGAGLQYGGGVTQPHQSILDATAPRRPRVEGARPRGLYVLATSGALPGGAVPSLAVRADAALPPAGYPAVVRCPPSELSHVRYRGGSRSKAGKPSGI